MARPQSRYVCQSCGATAPRWEGRCHVCGTWDSLVETLVREPSRAARAERLRKMKGHGTPVMKNSDGADPNRSGKVGEKEEDQIRPGKPQKSTNPPRVMSGSAAAAINCG